MIMAILPKIIGSVINLISYFSKSLASRLALDLFSRPLKGRYKTPHLALDSAKKEFIKYEELTIAVYNWSGANETVLLAHGWESNSGRWKNTVNALKKNNFNIVSVDAPAHGASGSKTFNAILYSKFIEQVSKKYNPSILIGHSVGGMAISYFLKNTQYKLVKKIIFLGSPAGFPGILKNYIKIMGYNKRLSDGIEIVIQDRFGFPSSHFNTAKFLKNISCQGLIIHDEHDPVIPFSDAIEIQKSLKNSELLKRQGLGHGLKSKNVINAITDFIKN